MGEPVGYTCGIIDSCKSAVEELAINVDCDTDFDDCTVEQLRNLHEVWEGFDWDAWEKEMEEIRAANDALRNWGNESEVNIRDLEDELEESRGEVETLQGQVNNLEQELENATE